MRPRSIATMAAAASAAFLLSACALWFGPAETDAQRLYQKAGEYVYASIPVEIYVKRQDADGGVVAAVCKAEADVHGALVASLDNFATNGQRLPMGFLAISKTLGVFAAEVFGAIGIPDDPAEALNSGRILAAVGVAAVGPMREFRKSFLKPRLDLFKAEGRGPTIDEWTEMRTQVTAQHDAIAAPCAG